MGAEVSSKLCTCRFGDRNKVLDACCIVYLSSNALRNDSYAQAFAGRIDSRRCSSRTTTEYDNIIFTYCLHCVLIMISTNLVLQLLQKDTKITTTSVQWLPINVHRRYTLYVQTLYFILIKTAINHLIANIWVDKRHYVECLNNVRAVCTGE